MGSLPTMLLLVNALVFIVISLVIVFRVREAKGSLKLAKMSIALATTFAAAAFIMEAITGLVYSNELLAKQLYIIINLFTLLAVASLSSFAVFATYSGSRRNLIVKILYVMALVPPLYLVFTFDRLYVVFMGSGLYEVSMLNPGLTLYIIFGVPLGVFPLLVLARSFVIARRRRDKALSNRVALLLFAVTSNLLLLLIYFFGDVNWGMAALIAWIPAALLLLLSFLRTVRPIEPRSMTA
jgi:hypothetical protein